MDTALEHLSKEQLIALVGERDRVIREKEAYETQLLALIDKFRRMAFAQKRERRSIQFPAKGESGLPPRIRDFHPLEYFGIFDTRCPCWAHTLYKRNAG